MTSEHSDERQFAVIVPAAGASSRFVGLETKKPFVELAGIPIWIRTVSHFIHRTDVSEVVVVAAESALPVFHSSATADLLEHLSFARGGDTRAESVLNGIQALSTTSRFVAVHDAARPLLTGEGITDLFAAAKQHGAVLPGLPITSTVKQITAEGQVERTVDRSLLQLAQTPQVARRDLLEQAYLECANPAAFTDEASLLEAAGHTVFIHPGWSENIKITTAEDFALAEFLLERQCRPPEGSNS